MVLLFAPNYVEFLILFIVRAENYEYIKIHTQSNNKLFLLKNAIKKKTIFILINIHSIVEI